jgi:hypothetical protein
MINYSGVDSIVYDLDSGRTYIYAKGEISYQTFYLKADFIEFDWDAKTICAKQMTDSSGKKMDLVYLRMVRRSSRQKVCVTISELKRVKFIISERRRERGIWEFKRQKWRMIIPITEKE